uniref:Class I histocompatibility antigen, F10 alpha chain-like isoform X2 n=1 Tax=Pogona vitticeps TaxID=103695 RepID=A0ABM5FEZ6_9SAUR
MRLLGAPALLLGALALLLGGCEGSSSHTLMYFHTAVSEPNQGLPQFIAVGYVDGQLFSQYDSITRRVQPRVPWIKKVDEDVPQYWDRDTQICQNNEEVYRVSLQILRRYYNQSGGFHTWQFMCGCELREDGSPGRGHWQYAYDGRDYIALDKETLTWTAADLKAQITKEKWEKDPAFAQRQKEYLEEICIEWLQRHLEYGKESLLRRDPPVGKVTRKEGYDDRETLVCQAYGFYPKEIDVTWRKEGEVLQEGTFHRSVAPNPDGTYHAWLSIEIDPKERNWYRCHVDHASLGEPLVLAWEAPASNLGLLIGCVIAALLLIVAGIAGGWFYTKKRQEGYRAASKKPQVVYRAASTDSVVVHPPEEGE